MNYRRAGKSLKQNHGRVVEHSRLNCHRKGNSLNSIMIDLLLAVVVVVIVVIVVVISLLVIGVVDVVCFSSCC